MMCFQKRVKKEAATKENYKGNETFVLYYLRNYWCQTLLGILLFLQIIVMTAFGEHSFIAVHDNLDLFVAHNTLMKNQNIFFNRDATALMLGGISRNLLGSEFQLPNLLYVFLSPFWAYIVSYFLKILIGFGGFVLFVKDIYKEKYQEYKEVLWLSAAAFSVIPVFPTYGISFVSLPLLLYLLRKIFSDGKIRWWILLFFYPVLSYFSYFGFFILGYMLVYAICRAVYEKKIPVRALSAVVVLAVGYVCVENRLFMEILFSDVVTIRQSMSSLSLSLKEVVKEIFFCMLNPGFHGESSHRYFVFPVTLLVFLWNNIYWIKRKEKGKLLTEPVNLVYFFILFNCVIYGLYDFEPVRNLFESILPVLKGFQFNRTIFLNPFLWYFLFFLCLTKIRTFSKKAAYMIAIAGLLVCMFFPQVYNDFYSNCYHHGYEIIKGQPSSQLSFGEFYAKDTFDEIKKEIDYQGEWAVAYGMHPAILQFNGIATLDGYLGLYSQEYKETFGTLIAPALDKSTEFYNTFYNSGIRAYIYSGAGENTYQPFRKLALTDYKLYMDGSIFRKMGGEYIFSRIRIENEDEIGVELLLEKEGEKISYPVYVYKIKD